MADHPDAVRSQVGPAAGTTQPAESGCLLLKSQGADTIQRVLIHPLDLGDVCPKPIVLQCFLRAAPKFRG